MNKIKHNYVVTFMDGAQILKTSDYVRKWTTALDTFFKIKFR